MPIRLDASVPNFAERFQRFLLAKRETAEDVVEQARAIIADVAARGDAALIELSRTLDRVDLDERGLRVSPAEIEAAARNCDPEALAAPAFGRDPTAAY